MRIRFPRQLADAELLASAQRFAQHEHEATAHLVAHIADLDARRLYLAAGFASLHGYCCQVLRLSEHEAFTRIAVSRTCRRFPSLLEPLARGALTLTTIRLLAPHLTRENHAELLAEAAGRGKREVEELLAARFPYPEPPPLVRALPALRPAPAALQAPLAQARYEIRFTAGADTHAKLRRAQDLLRHALPSGDPAAIVDRALGALLEELERRKFAALKRGARIAPAPSAGSRHVPAEVRRAVWRRDDGRCAFEAADGRRCAERGFLEFHHVVPFAAGGPATTANIQLRCRAHNALETARFHAALEDCGPGRSAGSAAGLPGAAEPQAVRCGSAGRAYGSTGRAK